MFSKPFHVALKQLRLKRRLSQKALAEALGLAPSRLCKIERGHIRPSASDQRAIQAWSGGIQAFVPPFRVMRTLMKNGHSCAPVRSEYEPPRDRATHVRFNAALRNYPDLANTLLHKLYLRPDFHDCQSAAHDIVAESSEEAIFLMRLLVEGAMPCLIAPATVARLPQCIVDPVSGNDVSYHPMVCLAFPGDFYFFQATLQSKDWRHRVDVLRCKDDAWRVIEIDGFGHDLAVDARREKEIGLPTTRITIGQVTNLDFNLRAALGLT